MLSVFSRNLRLLLCLLLVGLLNERGFAQPGRLPVASASGTTDKVDLVHADSLTILNQPDAVVYKLYHNVKLVQKGVVLYCDLAIQNKTTNVIEAYGNVRMVQGDTINVRGDTLFYYGNNRQANVLGHVSLKDRKMTLTTARLDYDMLTGIAHYPVKGRIVDRENILTSDEGYYDTRSKQFTFQRNVRLLNQPPGKDKTTILADSLLYNSLSKIADFQGPTRIISKDGVLVARNGQYNTTTRVSNFRQRATVDTEKYTLTGDTLNFDNVNEVGIAHGNVVIVAKKDNTTLTGDHGRYNGKAGVSRMIGHALVRSPISQGADRDTLFMRADTLFSFDNKTTKTKKLVGQRNVVVFKSDLQSKCDSLVYDVNDSLLYFYKKPIVWSQNYQMEADSMTAKLKNNRINTMFLRSRAFVISQDTLRNFNQVKGRAITAFFQTLLVPAEPRRVARKTPGRPVSTTATAPAPVLTKAGSTSMVEKTNLERVIVEGNGQTIYFAVDEKNRLVGMNRTECSKMNIEFADSRVSRIRNYGRPDMYLTPPKELTESKKQLDGFRWREKEKPTKAQILNPTPAAEPKPAVLTDVVATLSDRMPTAASTLIKTATDKITNQLSEAKNRVNTATPLIKPVADKAVAAAMQAITKPLTPQSIAGKTLETPAVVNKPVAATPAIVVSPVILSDLRILTTRPVRIPVSVIPFRPVIKALPTIPNTISAVLTQPTPEPPVKAASPVPVQSATDSLTQFTIVRDSVATGPAAVDLLPAKAPVSGKPLTKPAPATDASPPAVSTTTDNASRLIPTNRTTKQQKADSQELIKARQKAVPVPSDASDLEQQLNRKPRKP